MARCVIIFIVYCPLYCFTEDTSILKPCSHYEAENCTVYIEKPEAGNMTSENFLSGVVAAIPPVISGIQQLTSFVQNLKSSYGANSHEIAKKIGYNWSGLQDQEPAHNLLKTMYLSELKESNNEQNRIIEKFEDEQLKEASKQHLVLTDMKYIETEQKELLQDTKLLTINETERLQNIDGDEDLVILSLADISTNQKFATYAQVIICVIVVMAFVVNVSVQFCCLHKRPTCKVVVESQDV